MALNSEERPNTFYDNGLWSSNWDYDGAQTLWNFNNFGDDNITLEDPEEYEENEEQNEAKE